MEHLRANRIATALGLVAVVVLAWIWWGGPPSEAAREVAALDARAAASTAGAAASDGGASPTEDVLATAVFAAGCFWCVEADYEKLPGVIEAVSGYTGGFVEDPSYRQVAAGGTGHREAVRVYYDPDATDYPALVDAFWRMHDPTDGSGSFVDRGFVYTSAIYVDGPEQRAYAEAALAALAASGKFDRPLATIVEPLGGFWVAEDEHQDFYRRSAARYRVYRFASGRDAFIDRVWAGDSRRYGPATMADAAASTSPPSAESGGESPSRSARGADRSGGPR